MTGSLTLEAPPHAPFLDARRSRLPGISPLDPRQWIEIDEAYAPQMAYRERLIREHGDTVHRAERRSGAMQDELLEVLAAHLSSHQDFARLSAREMRRPDDAVVDLHADLPLIAIGRLVQEDFCLLSRRSDADEHRLVAAIVCFPSRWSLADKIGRPLASIHEPVPAYRGRVAALVERMFGALRVDQPLIRFNWQVHPTPELHQPLDAGTQRGPRDISANEFWLRTERQTLLRLPKTRAIAFGIKTAVTPLSRLTARQRQGLATALSALSPADVAYRGGERLVAAVLRRLRS